MEKKYEEKYHDLESKHWWFKSRRNYIISILKNENRASSILDIGCSSGEFLNDFKNKGFSSNNLYGVDISEKAISNCKIRNLENTYVMDAQEITLNKKFDIIIASDCLEHLKDDKKSVKNWTSLLKENGKLLIFVPAYNWLWSNHDEVNMHYRRYVNKDLKLLIENENLNIVKKSYWNFFLLPAVAFYRLIENNLTGSKTETGDIGKSNIFINNFLLSLLTIENKLLKYINFPFGVSTFCIATKK